MNYVPSRVALGKRKFVADFTKPAKLRPADAMVPLLGLLLGFVLPISVSGASISDRSLPYWEIALAICVYSGFKLAGLIARGERQMFAFAFYLFCYLFMGFAPFVQLVESAFPSNSPDLDASFHGPALLVVASGIIMFDLGQWVARQRRRTRETRSRESYHGEERLLNVRRGVFLGLVALAIAFAFIIRVGPQSFLQDRTTLFSQVYAGLGNESVAMLIRTAVIASLLIAFVAIASSARLRGQRNRLALAMLAALLGLTSLFITNVFNSPRYYAIVVLAGLLSSLGVFDTRAKTRSAYVLVLLGFVYVFPILGTFRTSIEWPAAMQSIRQSLLSGDYDSFAQVNNALVYVEESGIEWGRQLLGALLVWVPRSVWPDKPVSTSTLVSEFRGYDFTNVSSPLWAELLVDFGVVGVVVGFFLTGYALSSVDARAKQWLEAGQFPGLAVIVLPAITLVLYRGALLSTMPLLLSLLACLMFVSGSKKNRDHGL